MYILSECSWGKRICTSYVCVCVISCITETMLHIQKAVRRIDCCMFGCSSSQQPQEIQGIAYIFSCMCLGDHCWWLHLHQGGGYPFVLWFVGAKKRVASLGRHYSSAQVMCVAYLQYNHQHHWMLHMGTLSSATCGRKWMTYFMRTCCGWASHIQ